MAADDGKKRTGGADPQALIDAESFWDEQAGRADEEEVTAPNQPRPQAPPLVSQPTAGARPADEEDDPDLAVVGPGGMFPGQANQGPSKPLPPARPAAQPRQPPRPQPGPVTQGRPSPPPPIQPPLGARQRPARPRPMPAAKPEPEVELETETANPVRIALALAAVVAVSAFLGWFLIGRHAGDSKPETEDPALETVEQPVPTDPQAAPKPDPATAAKADIPAQDPKLVVTLKVSSEPPGAQVFVDGEHRGVTPATVRGLPTTGEASLKIMLDGHKPWEQKIALDAKDLDRAVNAGLTKLSGCKAGTGFLYVTTRPPGATIELDGKRLPGKTPKVVNDVCAVVPHQIKLEKAGFRAWRQEVRIKPDDIHNLEAKLEH